MERKRVILITIGVMLSLFMASMEATVIATAMPTIVSQLGGLESYSWVFAIYMLTSTTTGPIYGKFSDLYGRRPIYMAAIGIFILGSIFCGMAQSMGQLIAARAIQGVGAGGLLPLAFIIVGDIFSLEQRTKVQGLFSGVWGVSSVIGPLLGGFIVDVLSWPWIFYINVGPAIIAAIFVWSAWQGQTRPVREKPVIDYGGAALLTIGVGVLLLGMLNLGHPLSYGALVLASVCLVLLIWVEKRAVSPIIPLPLFRDRMFSVACAHGVLSAWGLFGLMSYVPLYVQGVQGTTATEAGTTLTPLLMGWVLSSIVGSRLLLKISPRTLVLVGMGFYLGGAVLLNLINPDSPRSLLMTALALMGTGMGLSIPSFLIAVQSGVRRSDMGAATSMLQFARNIGGTLGVSIMGAVLSWRLTANLVAAGIDPETSGIDELLAAGAEGGAVETTAPISEGVRLALGGAVESIFVIALIAAILALAVTFLTPGGATGSQRPSEPSVAPSGD